MSFAGKLYPQMGNSNENSFFSPYSIQTALGMCAVGAGGSTKLALDEILEIPSDSAAQKAYFRSLNEQVQAKKDSPYELVVANAIWAKKGFECRESYSKSLREDFGASFAELDYATNPAGAAKTINEWCGKATRGKIPEIVNESFIPRATSIILTNAIYFLGKWENPFEKSLTKNEEFFGVSGTNKVPMMHIKKKFRYAENDSFQAVEIPYNGDLSMLVILPRNDGEFDFGEYYSEAVNDLSQETVILALPRFQMDTSYKMRETLEELGAGIAFSDSADFSGISGEKLKISQVVHKAFVKCDEEGTEAAAATAVGAIRCMSARPKPEKVFEADRPFAFAIRNYSDQILFCGRVTNLEQS